MNKDFQQRKEKFEKLPTKIWEVLDMTPEVFENLGALYKEEFIWVKWVEVLSERKFKFMCKFPPYEFTYEKVDHVSGVQMQLAFFQAAFCTLWLTIRNLWKESPMSFEVFYKNRKHARYAKQSALDYNVSVKVWEETYLIVEVEKIVKKMWMYIAYLKFLKTSETFMWFEAVCTLSDIDIDKS